MATRDPLVCINGQIQNLSAGDSLDPGAMPLPDGFRSGFIWTRNASDTTNDVDVTAGSVRSDDNTEDIILGSGLTKRLDATWAVGNNAGGLDTGSRANTTWYYIWAIKRTDTGVVDVLLSTSNSSPTMPTDYDKKALVGAIRTQSTVLSRPRVIQTASGLYVANESPGSDDALDVNTGALGTSRADFTLRSVPPLGVEVLFNARVVASRGSASTGVVITHPGLPDLEPTAIGVPLYDAGADTGISKSTPAVYVANGSAQISARSTGSDTTFRVQAVGYWWPFVSAGVNPTGRNINWRGAYSGATAYKVNDAVALDGSSYICIQDTTGNSPPGSQWDLLAEAGTDGDDGLGVVWRGAWDAGTAYVFGDAVSHEGSAYVANQPTTGDEPPSAEWDVLFTSTGTSYIEPDVQIFAESDTWTKPSGAVSVDVHLIGGGGGGGSGRVSGGGTLACGGGGGGGGGYSFDTFLASALGPSEGVTIGAGGTDSTNFATNTSGTAGGDGGDTSFGSHLSAGGGGGGGGGTNTTAGAGGAGGTGHVENGGAGATSANNSTPATAPGSSSTRMAGGGGGAGGAVTTSNTYNIASDGGNSGGVGGARCYVDLWLSQVVPGMPGPQIVSGSTVAGFGGGGGGGGGANMSASVVLAMGGPGGLFGGGGGGAPACRNAQPNSQSRQGAPGVAIIITRFQ